MKTLLVSPPNHEDRRPQDALVQQPPMAALQRLIDRARTDLQQYINTAQALPPLSAQLLARADEQLRAVRLFAPERPPLEIVHYLEEAHRRVLSALPPPLPEQMLRSVGAVGQVLERVRSEPLEVPTLPDGAPLARTQPRARRRRIRVLPLLLLIVLMAWAGVTAVGSVLR